MFEPLKNDYICNYVIRFVTVEAQGKGGKTQKTSARMQVQRQELDETAANIVEREAKTIAER